MPRRAAAAASALSRALPAHLAVSGLHGIYQGLHVKPPQALLPKRHGGRVHLRPR